MIRSLTRVLVSDRGMLFLSRVCSFVARVLYSLTQVCYSLCCQDIILSLLPGYDTLFVIRV